MLRSTSLHSVPLQTAVTWFINKFGLIWGATLLLGILSQAFVIAAPYLTKVLIDDALGKGDMAYLTSMGSLLLAVFVLSAVAHYFYTYLTGLLMELTTQEIRYELFTSLQKAPYLTGTAWRPGDILSRLASDVWTMQLLLTRTPLQFLTATIVLTTIVIILLKLDVHLAVLVIATLPTYAVLSICFGRRVRNLSARSFSDLGQITSIATNSLHTPTMSRQYGLGRWWAQRYRQALDKFVHLRSALGRWESAAQSLTHLFASSVPVLLLWYGAQLAIDDKISVGTLVAFFAYATKMFSPVSTFVALWLTFQSSLSAWTRISDVWGLEPECDRGNDIRIDGGLVLYDRVTFAYGTKPIVSAFSAELKRGYINLLVGHSGSGKTTTLNLLTRLYTADAGTIYIDGRDIATVRTSCLREQIAVVCQSEMLIDVSIADNIRLGRPCATHEEVVHAASLAKAHEFISELVHGYDTILKRDRVDLSGGQKQRISLARALLKQAPILVLDEPTSQVDPESEAAIYSALSTLCHVTTIIVAANRIPDIRHVRVIEIGSRDV